MRISEIHIAECGPLKKASWTGLDLRNLILIYGRNESGKSYLTDLIIRCLFKGQSDREKNKNIEWGYIRQQVSGKIVLSNGQNRKERLEFSTRATSRKKLEDYLVELPGYGLPPELVKLLVVRAGEVEIVRDEYGLSIEFLKNLFSQKRVLQEIQERGKIKETIKKASIRDQDGLIDIGLQVSEAKDYHQLREKLGRLQDLMREVNEKYELGELKSLQDKKRIHEEEKTRLELARRHQAYLRDRKIKDLKKKLEEIPTKNEIDEIDNKIDELKRKKSDLAWLEEQIRKLEGDLQNKSKLEEKLARQEKARRYQAWLLFMEKKKKQEELAALEIKTNELEELLKRYLEKVKTRQQKEAELKKKEQAAARYQWVKSFRDSYEKLKDMSAGPAGLMKPVMIVTLLALFSGLALLIFGKTSLAIFSLALALLAAILLSFNFSRLLGQAYRNQELLVLQEEYQKIFGEKFSSTADLEGKERLLEDEFHEYKALRNQVEGLNPEVIGLLAEIKLTLQKNIPEDEVESEIRSLIKEFRNKIAGLKDEVDELSSRFARLEVDQKEFEYEDPGLEFDREELRKLKGEIDRLNQLENSKKELTSDLERINLEIGELSREISTWFEETLKEQVMPDGWKEKLEKLREERGNLDKERSSLEGELKGLGVAEHEYLPDDPGEIYSPEKIREVEDELRKLGDKISQAEMSLNNLRQKIASQTETDFFASWNVMLEALFRKMEEVGGQLRKAETGLLARILLSAVIEELDREEGEKIGEILQAPEVGQMIERLTGRYNVIYPAREKQEKAEVLFVSDGANDFRLSDLSTGAREQVLLALRIAFIKNLLRGRSCFLVLDDAFQHTDYQRRPLLVDSLVELANSGWQIFYLTMDDHIKTLFQDKGSVLGEKYHYLPL